MRVLRTAALALFALATVPNSALSEAEQIGTATRIKTSVNGDYGSVEVSEPVHRNERITTSKSGLGEFLFRDGTKLAVGWGSVVKIDKYVFDDSNSVKKLTIRAAKGTFRWISGNSKSTAYSILTPAGTIGVRGTKFDFYVAPDGTVGLVMLSGSAQFCGAGGCIALTRRCDCLIAKPGRKPTVSRASRKTLQTLGNTKALPFLTGNQALSGRFGASTGCGMNVAAVQEPNKTEPKESKRSAPDRSQPNRPDAPSPSRPDAPNRRDAPTPNTRTGRQRRIPLTHPTPRIRRIPRIHLPRRAIGAVKVTVTRTTPTPMTRKVGVKVGTRIRAEMVMVTAGIPRVNLIHFCGSPCYDHQASSAIRCLGGALLEPQNG